MWCCTISHARYAIVCYHVFLNLLCLQVLLSSDFIFSRIVGSFPFSTMNPVPMKCIAIFMWSSGFPSQPGVRPSPHSHQLEGHAATIAPLGLWYLDSRSHQHRLRPHRKPTGNSINWRNQSIKQSIKQSQIKTNRMKIKIKMKSNRIESNDTDQSASKTSWSIWWCLSFVWLTMGTPAGEVAGACGACVSLLALLGDAFLGWLWYRMLVGLNEIIASQWTGLPQEPNGRSGEPRVGLEVGDSGAPKDVSQSSLLNFLILPATC